MQQKIFNFIFRVLRHIAPQAVSAYQTDIEQKALLQCDIARLEFQRKVNENKYADLIGKRVIVFGNNQSDPLFGYLEYLQNLNNDANYFPVIYDVLNKEHVVSFGVVMPYNLERLTMLTQLTPSQRWDFVNNVIGYYNYESYKCAETEEQSLTKYTDLVQALESCGFTKAQTFEEYIHPEPKLFETVASTTNS